MPPFIAFAIAGAAFYAGYRLIASGLERAAEHAERTGSAPSGSQPDDASRQPPPANTTPKDLGPLEWDAVAEVYRPSRSRPN